MAMGAYVRSLCRGEASAARWCLGIFLLAPLATAHAGYVAVYSINLLGIAMVFSVFTCSDLKQLSEIIPPLKTSKGRRDRNLRSFADFMTLWMRFLAHLVAVALCARVLSSTADHVTGGRTRRWLFGYETNALGEPWPDVLGVTVVMIVCAMFMCGLEENTMFTMMLLIVLYIFNQFFAIFGIVNLNTNNLQFPVTENSYQVFSAGAQVAYAFSVMFPSNTPRTSIAKKVYLVVGIPLSVLSGLAFLFANIMNGRFIEGALPIISLIETYSGEWTTPILASITVCGVSLAFNELCPALFSILVALASKEWRVLTRSMTYESQSTGSPVLAVFTAGSLAAILAFACPLSHMIAIVNASHLLGITIQSLQFVVMRCTPTYDQEEKGDIEYSRLFTTKTNTPRQTMKKKGKGSFWFLPPSLRHTKTLESIGSKTEKDKEDKECLLLDEYSTSNIECLTCSDKAKLGECSHCGGNVEHIPEDEINADDVDSSSSDDSTDIDAVVKEYKDTVTVVTAAPESNKIPAIKSPNKRGWKISIVGTCLILIGSIMLACGFASVKGSDSLIGIAIPILILGVTIVAIQPAHKLESWCLQFVEGPLSMIFSILFLPPLLNHSWPAIAMFTAAGVVIYARCERWCSTLAMEQVSKIHLHQPPLITGTTLTHVDTVYITR